MEIVCTRSLLIIFQLAIMYPKRYNNPMKYELDKTDIVDKWLNSRKNRSYRNRLLARFQRVQNGNFGDFKPITNHLFELRFFFGNGLRIYYTVQHKKVVLLLVGGDKSSQRKDIEKAKRLLDDLE